MEKEMDIKKSKHGFQINPKRPDDSLEMLRKLLLPEKRFLICVREVAFEKPESRAYHWSKPMLQYISNPDKAGPLKFMDVAAVEVCENPKPGNEPGILLSPDEKWEYLFYEASALERFLALVLARSYQLILQNSRPVRQRVSKPKKIAPEV